MKTQNLHRHFQAPALAGLLVFALLLLAAPPAARADILGFDDFESSVYTAGETIDGKNGGYYWGGAWKTNTSANYFKISTDPAHRISYTLLNGSGESVGVIGSGTSGNVLVVSGSTGGNSSGFERDISQAVSDGSDVFFSYIFKLKNPNEMDGTNIASGNNLIAWYAKDAGFSTNDSAGRVALGSGGLGGRVQAYVNANASVTEQTANSASGSPDGRIKWGETHLVVIKYTDWNGSAYRTVQIWLDPTTVDESTTNLNVTAKVTVGAGGSAAFNGLRTLLTGMGLNPETGNYQVVDNIRIGTTWADVVSVDPVTPPPPPPPPDPETMTTITEGEGWLPLATSLDIAPGGVFDFSQQATLDAPAGKYGTIRVNADGHFEFENRPGVRARFWGVNLVYYANYITTHEEIDRLADRIARSGYNTVRLHHFDTYLTSASDYDTESGQASVTLSETRIEQLDYLFYALKQRGIYINIDLFSDRTFRANELAAIQADAPTVTSTAKLNNAFKGLLPINEVAFKCWKAFATALLTHANPYTGIAWGQDPALIGICPVNEDPLYRNINTGSSGADLTDLYRARFETEFPTYAGTDWTATDAERAKVWNKFIYDLNAATDARLFAFLKTDLGVTVPLTGANYTVSLGLAKLRAQYDYVDMHQYSDHPAATGNPPLSFEQNSELGTRAFMPLRSAPARIFGKPFTMTEFHFSMPNRNRYEGVILMPAYASLQDWDAMYNFDYTSTTAGAITAFNVTYDNYFALAADPLSLVGDRLGSLLFQRGDIASAPGAVAYAVRDSEAYDGAITKEFENQFRTAGLVTRIGSLPGEPADVLTANPSLGAVVTGSPASADPLPAKTYVSSGTIVHQLQADGIVPADSAANGVYTSETGEIKLAAGSRTMSVVTDRGEHFLVSGTQTVAGDLVTVTGVVTVSEGNDNMAAGAHVTTGNAAISVVALKNDAEISAVASAPALADASRVLVTHLTDVLPREARFAAGDRKTLNSWGSGDGHLVRNGAATIKVRLQPGTWLAYKVDITGARNGQHTEFAPVPSETNVWKLDAATGGVAGAVLAYELVLILDTDPPEVSSVTAVGPTVGTGDILTIEGTGFATLERVLVDGVAAEIVEYSASVIKIKVPAGISSDDIVVVTSFGEQAAAHPAVTFQTLPAFSAVASEASVQVAMPDRPVDFAAVASGIPAVAYQWQHRASVDGDWQAVSGTEYEGAVTSTLTLLLPDGKDGWQFRCIATNVAGSAASGIVSLKLGAADILEAPAGVAHASGTLYVTDSARHTVHTINVASGTAVLLAGSPGEAGLVDATGTDARFNVPREITRRANGILILADTGNDRVRSVMATGSIAGKTLTAGTGVDATFAAPAGASAFDGPGSAIYIADTQNHLIKQINPNGQVSIVAGSGVPGSADGSLLNAAFNAPASVTGVAHASGTLALPVLYVADTQNHAIRRLDLNAENPVATTIAGQAGEAGRADGDGLAARFNAPAGIIATGTAPLSLVVADTGNSRLRLLVADGDGSGAWRVTTLAGEAPGFKDGIGANAWFAGPSALAVAASATTTTVYVADTGNGAIRRMVFPTGVFPATGVVDTLPLAAGFPPPPPATVVNPPILKHEGGEANGGGAPTAWFLAALAACAAWRLRRRG